MSGRSGEYFAIGATTGIPGYFVAHPIKTGDDEIIGAIAVKVDLRTLESGWQESEERVFVANSDGVIVLSGEYDWRYRTINPLTPEARQSIAQLKQFGREPLNPLGLVREGQIVSIDKLRFVEHSADVGRLGWKLYVLSPYQRVHERSLAVMAATAVAFLLVLAVFLFRRSERIRGLLISSQHERDVLNRLNQDLAREVEERLDAEKQLHRAQKELRQSSKLAALGQLAASVSHELGQPLAAMKTYIAGVRLPDSQRGSADAAGAKEIDTLLGKLDRLADRMSETTRQLRFFARRGGEAFEDVDLTDVVAGALETMRPAIKSEEARLHCLDVGRSVSVRGGRMRLEQVLVNLIRNGLDSMRTSPIKDITIALQVAAGRARIIVSDTGEGLVGGQEAQIFEPFVTTKASGEGLGLGLAISASIVKEHGGTLSAQNRKEGGAEFVLELPVHEELSDVPG